ncbi:MULTISPECIES: hypothetical protein [unclassified Sinorhizobium]|uniref:hypothetical protein n=1 Tax=unclassified Sinorhizobium TaxID=2613772 RepID=UPI0024C47174|nr:MULTISPECIES: hypothetical protein [unclassified Sinorhizobium]MDK1374751.1 hypothetical protein [Sinorhizobium sp. 6-70]MDK1479066.1 hypothetical protein [Sinorhizobium sp. 6-117]
MVAIMIDYKEEESSPILNNIEDGPRNRGVVVCLSSHRRWRSRNLWDRTCDLADEADPLRGEESWSPRPAVVENETEILPIGEPSLWLAGLVALISFASIIGFYWALTATIKVGITLSLAHF